MGVCSSCLGRRQSSHDEDGETSRLLYDDPYRSQYGTHNPNIQRPVYQPDPESVKREREALDGICHAMTDNVIDVFTVQPQPTGSVTPRPDSQHSNWRMNGDLSPEEMRLRTIKKGRNGPVFSTIRKGADGWTAVQEAIG